MKNNQHEFAIYFSRLSSILQDLDLKEVFLLEEADLVHRLERILRLKESEEFVLFDQNNNARFWLQGYKNHRIIEVVLIEKTVNRVLVPTLDVWLPLLKRDDLEEAVYSLVELGVQAIHLLQTEKVQRAWGGSKEFERLHRIMIAAAEQSKNFAFPTMHEPVTFESFLQKRVKKKQLIFFDVGGESLFQVVTNLRNQKVTQLDIIIGPESDLTDREKKSLKDVSVIICALTPTVLRACQAIAVGVGAIRSTL